MNTINETKGAFVRKTSEAMFRQFDEWNHLLNPEAREALTEVVSHIHDLAFGPIGHHPGSVCEEAHICPLDCGVGKTTALNFSIKQLIQQGYDQGILLLFYKVDEAEDFRDELVKIIGEQNVALITHQHSDREYQSKPVLIITQQRFCNRLTNRRYDDVELFQVMNQAGQLVPRKVRVWDEALRPAVSYAINTEELTLLAIAAGKANRVKKAEMLMFIEEAEEAIRNAKDCHIAIDIPDWGITDKMLRDTIISDTLRDKFLAVQGQPMSGSLQDRLDHCLMTFKVDVPRESGIWPMLVLDASYRVNKNAYEQMATSLPICSELIGGAYTKSYANMNVNHINTTTSKNMWGGFNEKDAINRERALDAIINALRLTEKRSLIICSKFAKEKIEENLDLPVGVLPPEFLTWGRHAATNDFKDFDNIIIAGLYLKPVPAWIAQLRAYKQLHPTEEIPRGELKEFITGDLWDSLYQAAMRGRARTLDGGVCKPMTLTVLGSRRYQYVEWDKIWHSLFPHCKVKSISVSLALNADKFLKLAEILDESDDDELILSDENLAKVGLNYNKLRVLIRKNADNQAKRQALLDELLVKGIGLVPGKGRARSKLVKYFEVVGVAE